MSISLSTHVLDLERGQPATGVRVELWREDLVTASDTDADGRINPLATDLEPGVYRLLFRPPSPFFKGIGLDVELEDGHYHIPLLVSSYGCTTYRGSCRSNNWPSSSKGAHGSSRSSPRVTTRSQPPTT